MARNKITPCREGRTPIDDISGLRVKIETREELNALEFANINKAYAKYLLKRPSARYAPFTHRWLQRVHKDMFRNVWSWAGEKRRSEKNLGAPIHKIGAEMNQLIFEFHKWEVQGVPPIEIATRIHHRLVSIHPFENGNGRWARMIADIYLHKVGLPVMKWPIDKSFVEKVFRPRYLAALKAADDSDYGPLLKLHREYQL